MKEPFREFPKCMYHPDGRTMCVSTPGGEEDLKKAGWGNQPFAPVNSPKARDLTEERLITLEGQLLQLAKKVLSQEEAKQSRNPRGEILE